MSEHKTLHEVRLEQGSVARVEQGRVAKVLDSGHVDPDPTLKKKPNPDPNFRFRLTHCFQ